MTDFKLARHTMVDRQIRPAAVTNRKLLEAIGEIPREEFVPLELRALAYSDSDLPLKPTGSEGQRFMVEPAILARLLQLAEVGEEDIVLDVGCATGYSSAVLSLIANSVVALEEDEGLAGAAAETLLGLDIGNVAVLSGPLAAGYAPEGPYDVISVLGAVEEVPPALLGQLKRGGRLVTIVGAGPDAVATLFYRNGGEVSPRAAFNASVPVLPGFSKQRSFAF